MTVGDTHSLGRLMKKDNFVATKGSVFGQYALTGAKTGQMRGATVVAAEDCHFGILDRESYDVDSTQSASDGRNRAKVSRRQNFMD